MARTTRTDSDPKVHARRVVAALKREYPETACALVHADPYQLLVATILSAQCTDARVNMVTPERLPPLSRRVHASEGRAGRARGADPFDRFLPGEGPQPPGHGRPGRRPPWRRDPAGPRGPDGPERRGTQDGQRRARHGLRGGRGHRGRYARQAAGAAPRLDDRQDARTDRARADAGGPALRVGGPESPPDPARPARLPGPPAQVRDVLACRRCVPGSGSPPRRRRPETRRDARARASRRAGGTPAG